MVRAFALITAAALGAATPLAAQQDVAFTPEEDLDCAIYVGALMAENELELSPDSRLALMSTMTYFFGRYEAQRGVPLAQALAERMPEYEKRNPQEIEQLCSLRARGLGMRMQDADRVMAELSPRPAQEPASNE